MQNLTRSARRRRAFLRINIALSICALGFASLTMASKAKEALASGPEDGVCANIIGSANIPPGATDISYLPYTWFVCRQSSAWYGYGIPFPLGPYYNCCRYEQTTVAYFLNGAYHYQYVEYFRFNSNGDATCFNPMGHNGFCLYD